MKRYILYIAVSLWLISSITFATGLFHSFENKIYDYGFLHRPPITVNKDIITIDIDDPAIETVGRWPWDWSIHRLLFEHLHRHQIRNLFVVDMDFPNKSYISLSANEEMLFKQVIQKGDKKMLHEIIGQKSPHRFFQQIEQMKEYLYFSAYTTLRQGNNTITINADVKEFLDKGSFVYEGIRPSFPITDTVVPPIREIQQRSRAIGINVVSPDNDGVIRRYPLLMQYNERLIPSIALEAVKSITNSDKIEFNKESVILITKDKSIIIPVNTKGEMTINWSGRYASSFVHIPFNLLASYIVVDLLKDTVRGINPAELADPMIIHEKLINESISKSLLKKDIATAKATILFLAFLMDYYFANTDILPEDMLPALGVDPKNKDILAIARQIYINNLAIKNYFLSKNLKPFDDLIKDYKIPLSADELSVLKDSYEQMSFYINQDISVVALRPLYFEPSKTLIIEGREYKINPTFLKGKDVFYGLTATGLTSQNPSPFMERHPMLDLVPQVVNTIITNSFIREIPSFTIYPLFAFYILIILITAFKYKPYFGLLITLLIASSHCFISWYLFSRHGFIVPVISPLFTLFISYSTAVFIRYYDEYRERMRVKKIFSTMVSPEVLKIMVQKKDSIALAGEIRDATVFSSDVSGFTTISEGVTAQELAKILNVYLSSMSNIIMSFDGYVDKYEGDAIKAVFGAPLPDDKHHFKACYSALLQQEELKIIQMMILIKYGVKITARMGINSGFVYAGNMGSQKRVQYTVMGETVKIAEELEPANKLFNTWIAAGEETIKRAEKYINSRYLGEVSISDMHTIKAYEVVGWDKEMYISFWEKRPIPELILESFIKISPERILASLSYYKKINLEESKILRDLISFFEELKENAIEMLKIEILVNFFEIQNKIEQLKILYLENTNAQNNTNDLITVYKNEIAELTKAIDFKINDKNLKEQTLIQIDGISKSLECFSKRLKIDYSDDDNLRELVEYLKGIIKGDISVKSQEQSQLKDRYTSLEVQLNSKAVEFASELKNRSTEYHQLIANLCV